MLDDLSFSFTFKVLVVGIVVWFNRELYSKKTENQYLILWQKTIHLWGRLKVSNLNKESFLNIEIYRAKLPFLYYKEKETNKGH